MVVSIRSARPVPFSEVVLFSVGPLQEVLLYWRHARYNEYAPRVCTLVLFIPVEVEKYKELHVKIIIISL